MVGKKCVWWWGIADNGVRDVSRCHSIKGLICWGIGVYPIARGV